MTGRRGWTLVEMLVAMAIVAALMSMAVPIFRTVYAQSQTTQNLANMGLTMKDFFIWSGAHKGRMVNWGLPQDNEEVMHYPVPDAPLATRIAAYPSQTDGWPLYLFKVFGEASPHWQSTYRNPAQWLFSSTMTVEEARRRDPNWEWTLPSDYKYSFTMLTKPDGWVYPGRGSMDYPELATYFTYIRLDGIATPSRKGVLLHMFDEQGPGVQRLVAFADGAVSQRDLNTAQPAASQLGNQNPQIRGTPVLHTLRGADGLDW